MSAPIADLIAPRLPFLRRFSRALNGSQESGDAYVGAMLEAMAADPGILRQDLPIRVALYRAFLEIWRSIPLNTQREPLDPRPERIADRRIGSLTPQPRQAFLLSALEEFGPAEVGAILDVSETEARGLIDTAGREIAEQLSSKVLIIEDEPLIALDIETLVTETGHKVVGVATTRRQAIEIAQRTRPEIVLADIQLADESSGIDAANDILKELDVPVVFITAYPERLLSGKRPEPAFLITKPFRPEMVKAVVSQALFFDVKAGRSKRVSAA